MHVQYVCEREGVCRMKHNLYKIISAIFLPKLCLPAKIHNIFWVVLLTHLVITAGRWFENLLWSSAHYIEFASFSLSLSLTHTLTHTHIQKHKHTQQMYTHTDLLKHNHTHTHTYTHSMFSIFTPHKSSLSLTHLCYSDTCLSLLFLTSVILTPSFVFVFILSLAPLSSMRFSVLLLPLSLSLFPGLCTLRHDQPPFPHISGLHWNRKHRL